MYASVLRRVNNRVEELYSQFDLTMVCILFVPSIAVSCNLIPSRQFPEMLTAYAADLEVRPLAGNRALNLKISLGLCKSLRETASYNVWLEQRNLEQWLALGNLLPPPSMISQLVDLLPSHAIFLMRRLAKTTPEIYNPLLAEALYLFGGKLEYKSLEDAASFIEEAVGIKQHIPYRDYRSRDLTLYLSCLAFMQERLGQHQRSMKSLNEQVIITRDNYYAFVDDNDNGHLDVNVHEGILDDLLQSLRRLCNALSKSGSEGLAPLEEAVDFAQRHPTYRGVDGTLLPLALEWLGDFHHERFNHEGACAAYQLVHDFCKDSELKHHESDRAIFLRVLRSHHKSLLLLKRHEEAEEAIREAWRLVQQMPIQSNLWYMVCTAFEETIRNHNSFLRSHGRFDEALGVEQKAVSRLRQSSRWSSYTQLARSLSNHALTLRKLGRLKKGYKVIEEAIRLLRDTEGGLTCTLLAPSEDVGYYSAR